MKLTENFRLPKQFKRIMATIVHKNLRDAYRQASIQAQMGALTKPEKEKEKKSDNIKSTS